LGFCKLIAKQKRAVGALLFWSYFYITQPSLLQFLFFQEFPAFQRPLLLLPPLPQESAQLLLLLLRQLLSQGVRFQHPLQLFVSLFLLPQEQLSLLPQPSSELLFSGQLQCHFL